MCPFDFVLWRSQCISKGSLLAPDGPNSLCVFLFVGLLHVESKNTQIQDTLESSLHPETSSKGVCDLNSLVLCGLASGILTSLKVLVLGHSTQICYPSFHQTEQAQPGMGTWTYSLKYLTVATFKLLWLWVHTHIAHSTSIVVLFIPTQLRVFYAEALW